MFVALLCALGLPIDLIQKCVAVSLVQDVGMKMAGDFTTSIVKFCLFLIGNMERPT